MDTDEKENPFGDGVDNRGVDDDDENIPLVPTSSRRGSEDITYHPPPPIQELTEKHLLLKE